MHAQNLSLGGGGGGLQKYPPMFIEAVDSPNPFPIRRGRGGGDGGGGGTHCT